MVGQQLRYFQLHRFTVSENITDSFFGVGLLFFTCTVVGMQYQKRTAG